MLARLAVILAVDPAVEPVTLFCDVFVVLLNADVGCCKEDKLTFEVLDCVSMPFAVVLPCKIVVAVVTALLNAVEVV